MPREDPADNEPPLLQRIAELERELAAARRLEEQLQESEERFRQVTHTIDEVFWMTDPRKDKMLFISAAYERIWGRTCQSLLDHPISFVDDIHPDDRAAVIAAFPRQKEGAYDIEYRIVRRDGGIRWIRDRAFPVRNAAGEIYRVVGVAQDITENKNLLQALYEEKLKTERLLENILPKSIIAELKQRQRLTVESPVIAQHIAQATVLFADLVGFTTFAQSREAAYVVNQLNQLIHAFDELVARHGVEKIKTIGDCYMLAGGVPDFQPDHAVRVAEAALAMREELVRFNRAQGQSFRLRIGIHSGGLVAGVIGTQKYVYDVWGDTVNTASRMESHGVPGEIQVSEDTRRLLGDAFQFEDRGTIAIKGRGEIRTYLLKRRAESD